ncbi:MAG TPA: hypothetical protein VFS43_04475 [Polyangiaceae bacterium]|nr:hypothetical protein [Polyangiaceae bacterium]
MAATGTAGDFYTQLLALSEQAMLAGRYEVAYHALAGAMHATEGPDQVARLEAVAQLAERQGAHIDEHAPASRLSSQSAHRRGNESIFLMLARQARMKAQLAPKRGLSRTNRA